jgi:hypothetical protein
MKPKTLNEFHIFVGSAGFQIITETEEVGRWDQKRTSVLWMVSII